MPVRTPSGTEIAIAIPTIIAVPRNACFIPPPGMFAGRAVWANRLTDTAATPSRTTR